MGTITRQVDMRAPAAQVWALLEDVRRLPEFSSSTTEVDDAPERLTSPGQTYVQVGRLLGRRYRSVWTIKDIEPGRRIQSEGCFGPGVRYCLTQDLEDLGDDRSRLSITMEYGLPGGPLGRLAEKAGVESRASREAQAVLDGIRSIVERGG